MDSARPLTLSPKEVIGFQQNHNVARLRAYLNQFEKVDQGRFAALIGCSIHTLQSIESGRLKLSENLAHRIARETNVDLGWLLENNLEAPIVRWFDIPYRFEDCERAQASKLPEFIETLSADYAAAFYGQIRAILSSAAKRGRAEIALYRIAKILENCRRDFGHDKELLPPRTQQFGKRADNLPTLKHWQVEAGIRLFREYDRESESIIRRTREQMTKPTRFVTDMGGAVKIEVGWRPRKKRTTGKKSRRSSRHR